MEDFYSLYLQARPYVLWLQALFWKMEISLLCEGLSFVDTVMTQVTQIYLRVIVGSVPEHFSKVNIAIKQAT